jgi:hypothetical protein
MDKAIIDAQRIIWRDTTIRAVLNDSPLPLSESDCPIPVTKQWTRSHFILLSSVATQQSVGARLVTLAAQLRRYEALLFHQNFASSLAALFVPT